MKMMLFDEVTQAIQKYQIGSIVGVINPKPLKPSHEYGYSYCVDLEPQIFFIGFSEEFTRCRQVGKEMKQCTTFLNKSVETICETHRYINQ